jgi:hypothetical protein
MLVIKKTQNNKTTLTRHTKQQNDVDKTHTAKQTSANRFPILSMLEIARAGDKFQTTCQSINQL